MRRFVGHAVALALGVGSFAASVSGAETGDAVTELRRADGFETIERIAVRVQLSEWLQPMQVLDIGWQGRQAIVSLERHADDDLLLAESFEGSWPAAPWSVSHPADAADVDWGRSSFRASSGSHSIWCAGTGSQSPAAGGAVPAETSSWAIVGPFDLTEAASGKLTFDLWLESEEFHDLFLWLASTDGEVFFGEARSTNTNGWKPVTVDLAEWPGLDDLPGSAAVWFAFVYRSDQDHQFEGAYVDNVLLEAAGETVSSQGVTYASDDDFALGTSFGLETGDDSLQLASDWSALPFIWVPNSGTGTVSKVDTENGFELARYRTGPERELDPSPIAVDLYGDCWVGNRGAGTVVKIGLLERDGCIDRDGDGSIQTSADDDGDGNITDDECFDWGDDECVLYEVLLVTGVEEVFTPGHEHDGYAENLLDALAVDAANNLWAGVYDSSTFYQLEGSSAEILGTIDVSASGTRPFGLVIDRGGALWSASWPDQWVLWIDTETGLQLRVDLGHSSSGLALDGDEHLFVTGYEEGMLSRVDLTTLEVEWSKAIEQWAHGLAVTSDGDVWVVSPDLGTVIRYSNDGSFVSDFRFLNLPIGVAVDGTGKVWVTLVGNDFIVRIDPETDLRDLEKELIASGGHDSAGDLTGIIARSVTSQHGLWTATHDSQVDSAAWGTISWQGTEPDGTSIGVRVRSSADEVIWSAWEQASNGAALSATPVGRYLQLEVSMQLLSGDTFPVLEELTVAPADSSETPQASFSWSPAAPSEAETVQFTDASTGEPTSWEWDFGDGASSTVQNPTHAFAAPGRYSVVLQVTNDAGSDSATQDVTVSQPEEPCQISCAAASPATVAVDEPAGFTASAEVSNCDGEVSFDWAFGDGGSSSDQAPIHGYSAVGTYSWLMTSAVDDVSCSRSGNITIVGDGPQECSSVYWVPVVSRAEGAFSSVWRSDLGLLGLEERTVAAELRFHAPGGTVTRVISVSPQAMVDLVDLVDWISPGSSGSGALEICADGLLEVSSRVYNQLADDHQCSPGGTLGQRLEGAVSADGLAAGSAGVLAQLRENDAFRTNFGFTNTGTEPAQVEVSLLDATGVARAVYSVEIEPGQWQQDYRPLLSLNADGGLDAASARVEVMSGTGVFVYASVIDNATNDAITVPAREVDLTFSP